MVFPQPAGPVTIQIWRCCGAGAEPLVVVVADVVAVEDVFEGIGAATGKDAVAEERERGSGIIGGVL